MRNLVERAFCRIKDFRRVATRYDKLAATYAAAISLAALVTWWLRVSTLVEHGHVELAQALARLGVATPDL